MEKIMATKCPATSHTNPVKAIRLKCLDCSGGSTTEVLHCVLTSCALHPFRLGKNPFRTPRVMTEEQRAAAAARLAKARKEQ